MKQKSNANTGFIQNLQRDQKDFRRASRWVSDLIFKKALMMFSRDELHLKPTKVLCLEMNKKLDLD